MSQNGLFLMEFLIFDGAALGLAGWELWSLKRDRAKTKADPPGEAEPPSPAPPRHPEG